MHCFNTNASLIEKTNLLTGGWEEDPRKTQQEGSTLFALYFNRSIELGSSVLTRELHRDGESFGLFYRVAEGSLKLSPFLNKQDLYVIDCSPTSFTVFASRLMLTLTLILLTWRIWRAPNNASKWQMGFNLAFKGLTGTVFWNLLILPSSCGDMFMTDRQTTQHTESSSSYRIGPSWTYSCCVVLSVRVPTWN